MRADAFALSYAQQGIIDTDVIGDDEIVSLSPIDVDIVGTRIPGIVAARGFYLCCPFDIRDKGDPCFGCAISLDDDRASVVAWQYMYNAAWCHCLGGFLNGGKGMIQ